MFRRDWVPPEEYNNSEYEGLDLELSDNFPALAFRIKAPDRAAVFGTEISLAHKLEKLSRSIARMVLFISFLLGLAFELP